MVSGLKPASRTLAEMKTVLLKESDAEKNPNRIIYDVYRGAGLEKNRAEISHRNLRYDITYLYSERLGKELPKTFGHYHKTDYPEIMEVLSGRAMFLMQRCEKNPKTITETYLIEAKKNEKIIILPGYGLISINPLKNKRLVLANWLSLDIVSDYEPYKNLHGACYYALENGDKIIFEKNKNYTQVSELIKLKPKQIPEFGAINSKSLYSLFETPGKLEFLNNPKKYKNLLTVKNCYSFQDN